MRYSQNKGMKNISEIIESFLILHWVDVFTVLPRNSKVTPARGRRRNTHRRKIKHLQCRLIPVAPIILCSCLRLNNLMGTLRSFPLKGGCLSFRRFTLRNKLCGYHSLSWIFVSPCKPLYQLHHRGRSSRLQSFPSSDVWK